MNSGPVVVDISSGMIRVELWEIGDENKYGRGHALP